MKKVTPVKKTKATTSMFHLLSKDMADLIVEKQAAYGDSFGKAQYVMNILYPKGISRDQMQDALTIIRIVDKLFRVATKKNAFGENPFKDVMGYAMLAVVREQKDKAERGRVRYYVVPKPRRKKK